MKSRTQTTIDIIERLDRLETVAESARKRLLKELFKSLSPQTRKALRAHLRRTK